MKRSGWCAARRWRFGAIQAWRSQIAHVAAVVGVGTLAAAATLTSGSSALACGGTFCGGGPTAMPVDQSGENILFVVDAGTVEAHIQIQYEGEAESFAWVLPLPAVPDQIRIGSSPLFTNLLNSTVPSYGYNTVCGSLPLAISGGGAVEDRMGDAAPLVVVTEVVGAFEVSILEGGTAGEVIAWLGDNGYEQIPEAEAIFEDYIDQNHVFAAVKLTAGAQVEEIHPIVVRYPGDTPCVPLKLTRVAAIEDMAVRVFFLGDERYVPSNYKHVRLNPAAIDWSNFASNYVDVVSKAVDSEVADGRAFVTEFAGASSMVSRQGIYSSAWDAQAFLGASAEEALQLLEQQGFMRCDGASCAFSHPLIEPMLAAHLPAPSGVDAHAFYDCFACFAQQFDETSYDATSFAEEFISRIVVPGRDASALLNTHPFLTRMFTTISPHEMTVDPLFHTHGQEPVSRFNQVNRARGDDSSSVAYQVTEDWLVELASDQIWPPLESMPGAFSVEEYVAGGDRIELLNFSEQIEAALNEWNADNSFVGSCEALGLAAAGAPAVPLGSSNSTGTSGSGGTMGQQGSGGSSASSADPAYSAAGGGGCAMSGVGSRDAGGVWLLWLVVGWGWRRGVR